MPTNRRPSAHDAPKVVPDPASRLLAIKPSHTIWLLCLFDRTVPRLSGNEPLYCRGDAARRCKA